MIALLDDNSARHWDWYAWYYRWTHNWHDCNTFCKVYIGFDFAVLLAHIYLNVFQLNLWGQMTAWPLYLNTVFAFSMSRFAAMLILGRPEMMMAPKDLRIGIFTAAVLAITLFLGNLVDLVFRVQKSASASNGFSEVVNSYLLML